VGRRVHRVGRRTGGGELPGDAAASEVGGGGEARRHAARRRRRRRRGPVLDAVVVAVAVGGGRNFGAGGMRLGYFVGLLCSAFAFIFLRCFVHIACCASGTVWSCDYVWCGFLF
jgi:hypothetical protein